MAVDLSFPFQPLLADELLIRVLLYFEEKELPTWPVSVADFTASP